jgi:hypothetical protein
MTPVTQRQGLKSLPVHGYSEPGQTVTVTVRVTHRASDGSFPTVIRVHRNVCTGIKNTLRLRLAGMAPGPGLSRFISVTISLANWIITVTGDSERARIASGRDTSGPGECG